MHIMEPQTVHARLEYLGRPEMPVYLLKGKEYMIVEGGMSFIVPDLLRQFRERQIDTSKITRLLILHSHFDHCGTGPFLKRTLPALRVIGSKRTQEFFRKEKVIRFIGDRNREMLVRLQMEDIASKLNLEFDRLDVDEVVKEGNVIDLGEGTRVHIIESPGHSSCSLSAYVESLRALFPSDASGIFGQDGEIYPSGNEDFILYQHSLRKLLSLNVEILCASRNGVLTGPDARQFIVRSNEAAEKMRREVIRFFREEESPEEKLIKEARRTYEKMNVRDIPWEIHLALLRGMVKNILQDYQKNMEM